MLLKAFLRRLEVLLPIEKLRLQVACLRMRRRDFLQGFELFPCVFKAARLKGARDERRMRRQIVGLDFQDLAIGVGGTTGIALGGEDDTLELQSFIELGIRFQA